MPNRLMYKVGLYTSGQGTPGQGLGPDFSVFPMPGPDLFFPTGPGPNLH